MVSIVFDIMHIELYNYKKHSVKKFQGIDLRYDKRQLLGSPSMKTQKWSRYR